MAIITADLTSTDLACIECGSTDDIEVFLTHCGYRADANGQAFCDDCLPRCHAACCDPDYFNDLRFNN